MAAENTAPRPYPAPPAPAGPARGALPLWLCEVRDARTGAPVSDAGRVAEAASDANGRWGVEATNEPEPAEGEGAWLVPLSDEAAAALGSDCRVRSTAGLVWLEPAE